MNEFSLEIWRDNYRAPGENSPKDTWKRLSVACSAIEKETEKIENEFYWALEDFKFIPGGRIMANLGTKGGEKTTLFNCFTNNPKDYEFKDPDSIQGIYTQLYKQAETLKSEGGYGTNFSYLRPAGSYIKGISSRTPGILKFMELWDKSSEIVTMGSETILGERQEGEKQKIRKGAQMAVLSVWHPEIEEFIIAKQTAGRLTKFNMSVGITKGFMEAVKKDKPWNLIFPDVSYEKYEEEWDGDIDLWKSKGYPIIKYKTLQAKDLWEQITLATYNRNEPGVLFLDLFNQLNPLSYAETILQTNPCGEIGMATGVCDLGSINLAKCIKDSEFDFDTFKKLVRIGIRFLDNINDLSSTPLPEYDLAVKEKRRIGLGCMGLGSLHFILKLRFGSPESLELIERIYKLKAETELIASAELGKEKGSFPLFDSEKYFNTYWWKNLKISPEVKEYVESLNTMRNSHRSMNAPTGNTGIYAQLVSGGIEPVFMKEYTRWSIVTEGERARLRKEGFLFPDVTKSEWFTTDHLKEVKKGDEVILKGTFNNTDYEIDKNRGLVKATDIEDYGWSYAKKHYPELLDSDIFATTSDLSIEDHVSTLKVISHYTDMNNSKTTNVPENYSYEDFKGLYMYAWENKIKGITTYRAGTMTAVIEHRQKSMEKQTELEEQFEIAKDKVIPNLIKLPDRFKTQGHVLRDNNHKKWYVNVALAGDRPFALFVNSNSHEGNEVTQDLINEIEILLVDKGVDENLVLSQTKKYSNQNNITKMSRSIGMALRHNIPIGDIVHTLDKFDPTVSSFLFHIKKLLCEYIKDGTKVNETCLKCGSTNVVYQERCKTCKDCGWAAC